MINILEITHADQLFGRSLGCRTHQVHQKGRITGDCGHPEFVSDGKVHISGSSKAFIQVGDFFGITNVRLGAAP